jgi:hypothetical protein
MKYLIKNGLGLLLLNFLFFYILQLYFINTLIFEKITIASAILIVFLVVTNMINYERLSIILIIYIFLILFFVNIDRSKSFYVLYWIEKYEIVYNSSNSTFLENIPELETRISEFDFSQRIQEHQIRGLVAQKGAQLKLTGAGQLILRVSEVFAKYFRLTGWVGNELNFSSKDFSAQLTKN